MELGILTRFCAPVGGCGVAGPHAPPCFLSKPPLYRCRLAPSGPGASSGIPPGALDTAGRERVHLFQLV